MLKKLYKSSWVLCVLSIKGIATVDPGNYKNPFSQEIKFNSYGSKWIWNHECKIYLTNLQIHYNFNWISNLIFSLKNLNLQNQISFIKQHSKIKSSKGKDQLNNLNKFKHSYLNSISSLILLLKNYGLQNQINFINNKVSIYESKDNT